MIELPKILPITSHTDFVGTGSTFIAIQGMKQNGVSYITTAVERGATTIVIEDHVILSKEIETILHEKKINLIKVANARKALATLSSQAFDYPARKLKILALTGTKGKTSSAFMLEHVLATAGYKTALLSTVYNKILQQQFCTNLTTQHPDYIHMFLHECVKAGVEYVVLEAAAQAYNLFRLHGIEFDGCIFTNFDQEHAEFYTTMDDYFYAKASLLEQAKKNTPVLINGDNQWCNTLIAKHDQYISFGKSSSNHGYQYFLTQSSSQGTECVFFGNDVKVNLSLQVAGEFNVYNALGVFGLAHKLGIPISKILEGLTTFKRVPGRLERYSMPNQAVCYIDYAHNPSSFQSVLSTLRPLTQHFIVVTGAGGDRDKTKRPLMGALATAIADFVIFTSDNPRSEDPQAIINDMLNGIEHKDCQNYAIELDREQAIKKAYALSQAGTIIALLGKGPDRYQQIGATKFYFNEEEIIKNL